MLGSGAALRAMPWQQTARPHHEAVGETADDNDNYTPGGQSVAEESAASGGRGTGRRPIQDSQETAGARGGARVRADTVQCLPCCGLNLNPDEQPKQTPISHCLPLPQDTLPTPVTP